MFVYAVENLPRRWFTGEEHTKIICNYSEPCEMEEKIANHACMNERFFLEFHMARSNIEMQRKRNRDGVLNSYLSYMSHSYVPM